MELGYGGLVLRPFLHPGATRGTVTSPVPHVLQASCPSLGKASARPSGAQLSFSGLGGQWGDKQQTHHQGCGTRGASPAPAPWPKCRLGRIFHRLRKKRVKGNPDWSPKSDSGSRGLLQSSKEVVLGQIKGAQSRKRTCSLVTPIGFS